MLVAALLACGACRNGDEAEGQDAPAEIYSAILSQLVAERGPIPTTEGRDDDELPPLFVEPLGTGYVIDLTVQADVVERLETVADVRFIDNRMEAVEDDEPGKPVRDGGMLVGLGPLLDSTDGRRTVQVQRYLDAAHYDDVVATVTATSEGWAVLLA